MPALTDRGAACERLGHAFRSMLDGTTPPDAAVPPAGGRLVDREDRGEDLARTPVPMFPEERTALDPAASVPPRAGAGARTAGRTGPA